MKKLISCVVCLVFVLNLAGCGTILYPERKGQVSGQLDPSVVLLDALGLLFFFVPGVVAFAVDFTNGTIYLPGGKSLVLNEQELESISKDGTVDMQSLQNLMGAKTAFGKGVQVDSIPAAAFKTRVLNSSEQVLALLQQPAIKNYAAL